MHLNKPLKSYPRFNLRQRDMAEKAGYTFEEHLPSVLFRQIKILLHTTLARCLSRGSWGRESMHILFVVPTSRAGQDRIMLVVTLSNDSARKATRVCLSLCATPSKPTPRHCCRSRSTSFMATWTPRRPSSARGCSPSSTRTRMAGWT